MTPEAHELFEEVWGSPLPERSANTSPPMMDAVERGEIRCMYVIGENPAQSDADEHYHDELFGGLDLLVVQDIMMTKTARMADVVLPQPRVGPRPRYGRQQRAAGAAGPQGGRPTRRGTRGRVDRAGHRQAHGLRLGLRDG